MAERDESLASDIAGLLARGGVKCVRARSREDLENALDSGPYTLAIIGVGRDIGETRGTVERFCARHPGVRVVALVDALEGDLAGDGPGCLGAENVISRPASFEKYLLFRMEMLKLAMGENGGSDSRWSGP